MKPFSERKPFVIGLVGILGSVGAAVMALQYDNIAFVNGEKQYSAYFPEAGGLRTGAAVQVAGLRVGEVDSIDLDGARVLVRFNVDDDVHLGARTEAAIKTKSLLGAKMLVLSSRGDGALSEAIPVERTTSPYQLPDALGDLAATVRGVDTDQVSRSLATLAETFQSTPPDLRAAVEGVARFSETLNARDAQLRTLLTDASKVTGVLSQRSDQIVTLIRDTNALLAELHGQSTALDEISNNISALAEQVSGLIAENRVTLRPALEKLNGVLATIDNRKDRVQRALFLAKGYVMRLGESIASGPFFKAYIANLFPGQFVQPFVDAAFSDLGLDPNTLAPSQLNDPQTGQPGTPALPVPFPRTGQGGEPRLTLPDAITGNPGDQGCGLLGLPMPGPAGCYPYREPVPPAQPGGPPPGPPAPGPGQNPSLPQSAPTLAPAPNEAPPLEVPAQ
ncbi:MCE family protein [Mycolicibacterium sp.]|uniref:MCE family protein n=1 Tax=Mycolicibacterium sp. TaxID=2320850 RepID=UPI003D0FF56C